MKMLHYKSAFAEKLHSIMLVLTHLIIGWLKRPLAVDLYLALPRLRHLVWVSTCQVIWLVRRLFAAAIS